MGKCGRLTDYDFGGSGAGTHGIDAGWQEEYVVVAEAVAQGEGATLKVSYDERFAGTSCHGNHALAAGDSGSRSECAVNATLSGEGVA